jgi:predicted short-subunit dehydrogenase-like oxidoreductase (DUF2520 family)
MKKLGPVALLAAGKISDSFIKKLPQIEEWLGPVRSTSLRLASRISNLLEAGYPVDDFAEFADASLILIFMPEKWLPPSLDEMSAAGLSWSGKTVLLCDDIQDSRELAKLAALGAATASLTSVAGFDDRLFVAEGDSKAIRQAKRFVERPGYKVVSLETGRKDLYLAGITFATSLALPLITASVETLRAGGLHPNDAVQIAERLFQRSLRSYVKGGRKGWDGVFPAEDRHAVEKQLRALAQTNPLLANYYLKSAEMVIEIFRRDSQWLAGLTPAMTMAAQA